MSNKKSETCEYKYKLGNTIYCKIRGAVMLSAFELMTDEQLKEEQRVLTAEIEAAEHRLNSVENEIFYRAKPECRRH